MTKVRGTFEGETSSGSSVLVVPCVILALGGLSGVLYAFLTYLLGWAAFVGTVITGVMLGSATLAVLVWSLLWVRDRFRLRRGEAMMGRPVPPLLPPAAWVMNLLPTPTRTQIDPPRRVRVQSRRADRPEMNQETTR